MNEKSATTETREANVLLELCMRDPMSMDVLDANSDDVLDAVETHCADLALGATISLRMRDSAVLLRFDVLATSEAHAYHQVADVMAMIEQHTDLRFDRSRSAVEVAEPATDDHAVTC